jgi:hypothetical protein
LLMASRTSFTANIVSAVSTKRHEEHNKADQLTQQRQQHLLPQAYNDHYFF